ncbi:unnamed protein product [Soboliphyme baturini]|uniref:Bestrophin homolog n=1 Tax=Soboliphyme baturini TaxID=241478 RepID=A0A183IF59_9BILA|nr:unnamed protein product [Soboliphyme baturini]
MTIAYNHFMSSIGLLKFFRLLLRCKGSIYRLIYKEVLVFIVLYYLLAIVYRFFLTDSMRETFEDVSVLSEQFVTYIPLTFVLGFYVSLIMGRWWNIFQSIAWPDRIAVYASCFIKGSDARGLYLRRTLVRYVNLAQVLLLRDISSPIRDRFPTMKHLVEAGYLSEEERMIYEKVHTRMHKFWIPWQWACSLVTLCRKENRIEHDLIATYMVKEIIAFRDKLAALEAYDWVSVPLAYTQVVTIAVYSYYLACLLSAQFINPNRNEELDEVYVRRHIYFPLLTILRIVFYMGWLKVAETTINPLGNDDDDFDTNEIIDRNIKVRYDTKSNIEVT